MAVEKHEVIAPENVQKAVKKMIHGEGTSVASKKLNVSRESLARIAGGITIRAGTLALVTLKLTSLGLV